MRSNQQHFPVEAGHASGRASEAVGPCVCVQVCGMPQQDLRIVGCDTVTACNAALLSPSTAFLHGREENLHAGRRQKGGCPLSQTAPLGLLPPGLLRHAAACGLSGAAFGWISKYRKSDSHFRGGCERDPPGVGFAAPTSTLVIQVISFFLQRQESISAHRVNTLPKANSSRNFYPVGVPFPTQSPEVMNSCGEALGGGCGLVPKGSVPSITDGDLGKGKEPQHLDASSYTCSICFELLLDPVVGALAGCLLRAEEGPMVHASCSASPRSRVPRPAALRCLIHRRPWGVAARLALWTRVGSYLPAAVLFCAGSCGHDFCMHCISAWKDERQRFGRSIQCPVCRAELLAIPSQSFGECSTVQSLSQRVVPVQPCHTLLPDHSNTRWSCLTLGTR